MLNYPLEGSWAITQGFGEKSAWYPSGYHNGIDFGCPIGTPVQAAADGEIIRAEMDATGYGLHVRIKHESGAITLYAHLSKLCCEVGDIVEAGALIGLSGSTGNSTGPHLHFEYRPDGKTAADPLPLLNLPTVIPAGVNDLPSIDPDIQPGDLVEVTAEPFLNIRTSPSREGLDVGDLPNGELVTVEAIEDDWIGVMFWIHGGYVQRMTDDEV